MTTGRWWRLVSRGLGVIAAAASVVFLVQAAAWIAGVDEISGVYYRSRDTVAIALVIALAISLSVSAVSVWRPPAFVDTWWLGDQAACCFSCL